MADSTELLERWNSADDRTALEELLQRDVGLLAERLRARARRTLRASVSADDLVHEAVLRYLRMPERPQIATPQAFRAYLWRAAWRLALNRIQRRGRFTLRVGKRAELSLSAVAASATGSQAGKRETLAALHLALNLLDSDDRDILKSAYLEEREVAQIAREMGLTYDTAQKRLSRARLRLAQKLRRWSDLVDARAE